MKFKLYFYSIFTFLILGCGSNKNQNFLIGTYTVNSKQGINVVEFDSKNKKLEIKNVITGVENPSFVIANKTKTIIIAVEETASNNGGKVTSFTYNKKSKKYFKINSCYTFGDHPCTVTFSKNEKNILVGNYSGGNFGVFPIDTTGKLSENKQIIKFEGNSVNINRQEKSHVHSIVFHPTENKIFITDLGRDVIEIIPFENDENLILKKESISSFYLPKGCGPRHLIFNKNGTKAFATFELTNQVGIFNYVNNKFTLEKIINLTTDETKNGSAAEIKLSKDEQFLYASVRGNDNFIAVLQLKDEIKLIEKVSTGKSPRNFILTENEENILVANELSNTISVYDRNKKNGLLTLTSLQIMISKPVYFCPF